MNKRRPGGAVDKSLVAEHQICESDMQYSTYCVNNLEPCIKQNRILWQVGRIAAWEAGRHNVVCDGLVKVAVDQNI